MPEMHLRQPGFIYSACGLQKRDSRYIYQNELHESCFQHDMAYGDFKDLNKRKIADKVLCDKAFNIAISTWTCFISLKIFDKKIFSWNN